MSSENATYAATMGFYVEQVPGDERMSVHVRAKMQAMGADPYNASAALDYGGLSPSGLADLQRVWGKLEKAALKAGASKDEASGELAVSGINYGQLVQLEAHWAQFNLDLNELGKERVKKHQEKADKDKPPRRRRGRR